MSVRGTLKSQYRALSLLLAVSMGLGLFVIAFVNLRLYQILCIMLSAGLALSVTGFCLLIHPLSTDDSFNALGPGSLVSALLLIISAAASFQGHVFLYAIDNFAEELWVIIFLFEGLSFFGSAFLYRFNRRAGSILWFVVPSAALVAFLLTYSNMSFTYLTHGHALTVLGYSLCVLSVVVLALTIFNMRKKAQASFHW